MSISIIMYSSFILTKGTWNTHRFCPLQNSIVLQWMCYPLLLNDAHSLNCTHNLLSRINPQKCPKRIVQRGTHTYCTFCYRTLHSVTKIQSFSFLLDHIYVHFLDLSYQVTNLSSMQAGNSFLRDKNISLSFFCNSM